jgi:hypothetical protein
MTWRWLTKEMIGNCMPQYPRERLHRNAGLLGQLLECGAHLKRNEIVDVVFEYELQTNGRSKLTMLALNQNGGFYEAHTEFATIVMIGPLFNHDNSSSAADRVSCAAWMAGGNWYIKGASSSNDGDARLFSMKYLSSFVVLTSISLAKVTIRLVVMFQNLAGTLGRYLNDDCGL